MLPVARVSDPHVCPLCKVATPIVQGGPTTKADGLPVAPGGGMTGCGAPFHKALP